MAKVQVVLPEELAKFNAVVCDRSELEHIAGMLEALTWTADTDIAECAGSILERLDKMLG